MLDGSITARVYIPGAFLVSQRQLVTAQITSRGFVSLKSLRDKHVSKPTEFTKEIFPDIIELPTCLVIPSILISFHALVSDLIVSGDLMAEQHMLAEGSKEEASVQCWPCTAAWIHVSSSLPSEFSDDDINKIMEGYKRTVPKSKKTEDITFSSATIAPVSLKEIFRHDTDTDANLLLTEKNYLVHKKFAAFYCNSFIDHIDTITEDLTQKLTERLSKESGKMPVKSSSMKSKGIGDRTIDLQDIIEPYLEKSRRVEVLRKFCIELTEDDLEDDLWNVVDSTLKHRYVQRAKEILDDLLRSEDRGDRHFHERDSRVKILWDDLSLFSNGLLALEGGLTSMGGWPAVDEFATLHRTVLESKCLEVANLLIGYALFEVGQQYVALSSRDITNECLKSLKKSWSVKLSKENLHISIKLLVTIAAPLSTVWDFIDLIQNEAIAAFNLNLKKKSEYKAAKLAACADKHRTIISAALEREENVYRAMRLAIEIKFSHLTGAAIMFSDDLAEIEYDGLEARVVRRMISLMKRSTEDAALLNTLLSITKGSVSDCVTNTVDSDSFLIEVKKYGLKH